MVPINLSGGKKQHFFSYFFIDFQGNNTLFRSKRNNIYIHTERHQAIPTMLTPKFFNFSLGCKTDAIYGRQLTTFPLCDGNWKYPGQCFPEARHLVMQGLGMWLSCRQLSQHYTKPGVVAPACSPGSGSRGKGIRNSSSSSGYSQPELQESLPKSQTTNPKKKKTVWKSLTFLIRYLRFLISAMLHRNHWQLSVKIQLKVKPK